MEDGQPIPGSIYIYAPNKGAPIFFTIAYAASAIGHLWQCYRYKSFKLIGLHPLCAIILSVGYALREYGSFNYMYSESNLHVYIVSQVFIYICPPLLELVNYHILGRIFYYVPYLSPLPPGRVLSIFGGIMAIIELLNSLGVSLAANPSSSHSQQELGSRLSIAALVIQLGIIIVFMILAAIFHRRCLRSNIHALAVSTPLNTLYTSMTLILIRCIYRLVEHTRNTTVQLDKPKTLKTLSPMLRYEWYFYIFEATLMLLNSVLWNVWNPGRYLPQSYHTYLARDGSGEIEGVAKEDERPLWAKVACLLTFGLLFRRKMGSPPFEELRDYRERGH